MKIVLHGILQEMATTFKVCVDCGRQPHRMPME